MDSTRNAGKLRVLYGDFTLGLQGVNDSGKNFSYICSYGRGGMESLVIDGKEWLYRTPAPTFWRALTDNDRGNGFHLRSGIWLAADMFLNCREIQISVDGKQIPFPDAPESNRYSEKDGSGVSGAGKRKHPGRSALSRTAGTAGAAGIRYALYPAHRRGGLYL